MHFPDVTRYCIKLQTLGKYQFRSTGLVFFLNNFFMKTDISSMASLISCGRYSSVIVPPLFPSQICFNYDWNVCSEVIVAYDESCGYVNAATNWKSIFVITTRVGWSGLNRKKLVECLANYIKGTFKSFRLTRDAVHCFVFNLVTREFGVRIWANHTEKNLRDQKISTRPHCVWERRFRRHFWFTNCHIVVLL